MSEAKADKRAMTGPDETLDPEPLAHARPTELPTKAPRPNPDSQPFWDGTAEGRFTLQRCNDCDTVIWWPRAICPECSSFDLARFEASGRATVYSHTVVHRSVGRWNNVTPYVLAYVELEEGPRVMTNVVDCDLDSIEIDTPVELVWHDTGEGTALPRFAPVDGGAGADGGAADR